MFGDDATFARRLQREIARVREDRTEQLANGVVTTIDQYRERVGYLAALRDVDALIEDIRKKLNGVDQEER